jgi:small subunit ribosomal protein S4
MKRKHKSYSRPKKPYDKKRIEEESVIVDKFGLKNKREIWKAEARVNVIRQKAKTLISASEEEKEAFFKRLRKIGLDVRSIADVLSLTKEDYMNRRLQTILLNKGLVTTIKSARQLIIHKKVLVNGTVLNSPSYIVPIELEKSISLKQGALKPAKVKVEEVNGN